MSFLEFAERIFMLSCHDDCLYAQAIEELEGLLREKDAYFSLPENRWVKDLTKGLRTTENCTGSAETLNIFRFFDFGEEKAKECIIKRLDEAIAQGKFVEFCTNFKVFVNHRQPPVSYYLIEEYFYKHLNQPDLSSAEKLFNKQLHNLYLRDLHQALTDFEFKFGLNDRKESFSEQFKQLYIESWHLQKAWNIPYDLAFHITIKHYIIKNLMFGIFFNTVESDLFTAKTVDEWQEHLLEFAELYFPVYSFVEDYALIEDKISVLKYWRKTCLEASAEFGTRCPFPGYTLHDILASKQ